MTVWKNSKEKMEDRKLQDLYLHSRAGDAHWYSQDTFSRHHFPFSYIHDCFSYGHLCLFYSFASLSYYLPNAYNIHRPLELSFTGQG